MKTMIKSAAILSVLVAMPIVGMAQTNDVTWKSSLSLGATFKDGNTEKTLYTANLKGNRYAEDHDWLNSLYTEYGKTEGEQTEGQIRGQSDYRRKFSNERMFGGIFAEVYNDALKDIDLRVKIGPNIGYYFITEKDVKFDVTFGINYGYQSAGGIEDNFAEYRIAANYLRSLSKTASTYANLEYSANVEDLDDGSGLLVIGVKSKLNEQLSMFAELRDEYDNMVAGNDIEHNDVTVLAGLTYDF